MQCAFFAHDLPAAREWLDEMSGLVDGDIRKNCENYDFPDVNSFFYYENMGFVL